ncbi:MAG: MarR family transcriptional regulator [Ruminococcus sp.]|nr:MarR family transcriptional regulator [Ruminococcus sp.]
MDEIENREIIAMIENIHLLRKLFIKRSTISSPLHFGQVAIMQTIEENENCTQSTIAQQLNVTPSSVATSTKRLQKAGFIMKTVDKDNLRCKRLSLTEKGRDTILRHAEILKEYDSLIMKGFSPEEKNQLFYYLNRLLAEMKSIEDINEQADGDLMKLTMLLHQNIEEICKDSDENKN